MNRGFFRTFAPLLVILLLALLLVNYWSAPRAAVPAIRLSTFLHLVETHQMQSATIDTTNQVVTGVTTSGQHVFAYAPGPADTLVQNELNAYKVKFQYAQPQQSGWVLTLLSDLLPVVLFGGLLLLFLQQTQGGGNRVMQFGRSRARLHSGERGRVTFEDVAGVDEAKEELGEVVDFLRHPGRYVQVGARIPKGVLLFGEPGTGKTLLARAVAGEAGVPFFSISGSDFVEMFVGVGASRVRDLFEQAKRSAPCIVFIDEIDAVGRMRGAGYGGGHDEREQTLNQLLVEMDGFGVNEGIIVMAATNRPDVLDPALLRPGRFDRQIFITRPDLRGRTAILRVHARNKPLAEDVSLEEMARRTPGFTGADLANMLNEAALLTARRRKKRIGAAEVDEAIERVILGPAKKSRVMTEKEKRIVAYHEAGHALVAHLLPNCDPVVKVSIISRGGAGGYTITLPEEDRNLVSRDQIVDQVTQALGGRAAEEIVFGEITSGASDDIDKATKMVRKMITEFGMSEGLGPLAYGTKEDQVFLGRDLLRERNYSEEVAAAIDREVRRVIGEAHDRAKRLLDQNRQRLTRVAERLMEQETMDAAEFEALVNGAEVALG
ncbi:MAG: ATP-dependent zinc metalloprotease FtsH [Firmicutes bacterium]|nr:ATP-dependent zinc metalloprotease FtsH [Bacillota bacterium]